MKNALLFTELSSIFACFISCGWVIKLAAYNWHFRIDASGKFPQRAGKYIVKLKGGNQVRFKYTSRLTGQSYFSASSNNYASLVIFLTVV